MQSLETPKFDVIVALNGGGDEQRASGLNEDTELRVRAALELKVAHGVGLLVAGHEAQLMGNFAESLEEYPKGADAPLIENGSWSTVSNAHNIKNLYAQPNRWRNIAVVTADFHAPRVQRTFDRVFGDDYNVHVHAVNSSYNEEERRKLAQQERLAELWDRALVLRNVRPDQDDKRQDRIERHDVRLGKGWLARLAHRQHNRVVIRH